MASLLPFQDLNCFPNSHTAITNANDPVNVGPTSSSKTCIPTLVPKLEPLDDLFEPREQEQPQETIISTPNPENASSSSKPASAGIPQGVPIEDHVYSEFNRISQMFWAAFPDNVQQSGDANVSNPDSRAIVPVPQENPHVSSVVVATRKRNSQRVKELVRVGDITIEDERNHRDIVRRTRMVYDSLRILTSIEEKKSSDDSAKRKRPRGDTRAATLLRYRGLWLNRDKRIVGAIPGINVGDLFLYRMELLVVGLHGQTQAGIDYLPASMSPNREPIATSVIVSGGYEDDIDDGDVIIYTGHGGQDAKHSKQIAHQKLEGGNLALERSMRYGVEVRVIRGIKYEGSASSSNKVYVYDGLYRIAACWFELGKSGFGVYKYKLVRIDGQEKLGSAILKHARLLKVDPLLSDSMCCFSLDISLNKETAPVRLFNDIDDDDGPLRFEYLKRTSFPHFVFHQSGTATGCECVGGCADDCFCALKNGGGFPYNRTGILLRGKPVIFECGPFCRCPPNCQNRVTQKGLKVRLEVFRSRETGWGVRSLDIIHAGAFVCEYTGVVVTRGQAQILTMNGDAMVYPSRFPDRWAEWGNLSQIYSNYVRPSYPSIPPLDFALDVSTMRNVAFYIRHSSTPNMFVQFVLYDHNNLMFPHLMLFAMETIPPLRELTLDYGVVDDCTGKLFICN
ncbi:histone-lysine N-methyltransferase family member SUVH9-like [Neltuma alba]|uniref:histone-lysine N-methyltransferase family member SUVH9-like n=1 Tax=Neltuma alba TaxID=207710 RepID=UPI0010A42A76|nr:histone-lysine N-methyltransferase family member SUVH9-like [Prosopis alba]XP_028791865.1 histone-lysine N-methyltransferase family member SUVH9-like [Prosopis alba]